MQRHIWYSAMYILLLHSENVSKKMYIGERKQRMDLDITLLVGSLAECSGQNASHRGRTTLLGYGAGKCIYTVPSRWGWC